MGIDLQKYTTFVKLIFFYRSYNDMLIMQTFSLSFQFDSNS